MKTKNNTDRKLVFYFGDSYRETPTSIIVLNPGEEMDLDKLPKEDIVIQDK